MAKTTVGRLQQTVVAKAFQEELFSQDPTDSVTDVPISALLSQVQ